MPSPAVQRRLRTDARALGQTLRAFRLSRELTQERLASRANVTKNYVSDLEGERRNPTVRVMLQLLDAMGVTWEEFGAAFDRARRE